MLQAAVAMGVGLLLFIPTFNALNDSYVEGATPPSWMIPDDFRPPEDFEPPEDYQLPEDFEMPEGQEIPPEWREKYKGKIPPGGCPPPAVRQLQEAEGSWRLPPQENPVQGGTFEETREFTLHETAVGFGFYVNVTDWRAADFTVRLTDPNATTAYDETEAGGGPPSLFGSGPVDRTTFEYEDSYRTRGGPPAPGTYTLDLRATATNGGAVKVEAFVALACGGLLAS